VLWREVRKIPAKLLVLMATAFLDMVGLLMILPLLPFYVKSLGGEGVTVLGFHFGIGIIVGFIIAAFTVAQLLSAPIWGRFSDRVGRRPALLIALTASAIAYLIFGFAESLWLLFLSRIVQGAGGGTVGVIQATLQTRRRRRIGRARLVGCRLRRTSASHSDQCSVHLRSRWASTIWCPGRRRSTWAMRRPESLLPLSAS
jgi:MFS family permease